MRNPNSIGRASLIAQADKVGLSERSGRSRSSF